MNSFVRRWNAHEARHKPDASDVIAIDGERKQVTMAERKKAELKAKAHTDKTYHREAGKVVSVNKHAVTKLALDGSVDRINALYLETKRTCERLAVRRWKEIEPLTAVLRGKGALPMIPDLIRWMDSLTRESEDIFFFKRLHKTLESRCTNKHVPAEPRSAKAF